MKSGSVRLRHTRPPAANAHTHSRPTLHLPTLAPRGLMAETHGVGHEIHKPCGICPSVKLHEKRGVVAAHRNSIVCCCGGMLMPMAETSSPSICASQGAGMHAEERLVRWSGTYRVICVGSSEHPNVGYEAQSQCNDEHGPSLTERITEIRIQQKSVAMTIF